MTSLLDNLALITAKTLEHYNEHATDFWNGTRHHDVKQNVERHCQSKSNRFHQKRTASWQISMPRSNNRSSTCRNDSG